MRIITFVAGLALTGGAAPAQGGVPGQHFIENWDGDGDGIVTLAELESHRSDVFYMFDADENGVLDAGEYVLFDETRAADQANNGGHGQGARRAAEGMTLAFNDADGDGQVTEEEFAAGAAGWMTLLDRDGDGAVTSGDFGRH